MARPICAHCGNAYGHRATTSETVKWPLDQERPPYRGNGIVLKESVPYKTANRETARGVTALSVNPKIRAMQEADLAKIPAESFYVATRTVWDGESYIGGYAPFCTLRCALDYARRAYKQRSGSQ